MSVQERSEEHIKELEAELEKLTKEKTHVETKFDYLKKKYKKVTKYVCVCTHILRLTCNLCM
jgi:hypothetical protein